MKIPHNVMMIVHYVLMTDHYVIYDDNVMMIVHYVMTILPLFYNGLRGGEAENNKGANFGKLLISKHVINVH